MSNEKSLDTNRLNAMKLKILRAEQENLRTGEKTAEMMADQIRKIIVSEVKRAF